MGVATTADLCDIYNRKYLESNVIYQNKDI